MIVLLLACAGSSPPPDDTEFGSDPRTDDTAVIPAGQFSLSDPLVEDANGDGAWEPGEDADVLVTITNDGDDFPYYPGVVLAVDHEEIQLETDDWYLYALMAGESQTATFQVSAASTIDLDTTVTFTAAVDVLNCEGDECPDPAELTFDAVIDEPQDTGGG